MRAVELDFSHGNAGGLTGRRACLNLSYMRATLTISLPPTLRRDVSRAAKSRRMSESEFVRAVGIYTDEDVFKVVS